MQLNTRFVLIALKCKVEGHPPDFRLVYVVQDDCVRVLVITIGKHGRNLAYRLASKRV